MELATFGAGCFWCVEAIFKTIPGVTGVEPGYAGGKSENPTYEQVCSGSTGHAEVCRIQFDPEIVSYDQLLTAFWMSHDPTTLNRQGADVGIQYRSVIFYHDENQRGIAINSKKHANLSLAYERQIVTEVSPLLNYSTAESYHHDYFKNNPSAPYCQFVIKPKVEKFIQSQ